MAEGPTRRADVSPIGRLLRRFGPDVLSSGDFRVGPQDVLLGEIAGCKFYIGAAQFEYWRHTQLIIDVVPGRGSGFSVEAPEGVRFLTRSRVFTDEEVTELRNGRTAGSRGLKFAYRRCCHVRLPMRPCSTGL